MISGRFTLQSLRRLFAVSAIFLLASMPLHASSGIPQVLMDKSVAEWLSLTPTVAATNVLLVKYAGPPPAELDGQPSGAAGLSSLHASMGSIVKHQYTLIPWQVVLIPPSKTLPEAAALYAAHPGVKFVEPNYTLKLLETRPNDTQYGNLWGMERINAPQAWDITTGSSNIIVAVIDTGVRYTHEDLKENMWVNPAPGPMNDVYGAAWTGGFGAMTSGDPMDTNGHGTHVAGTIGAVGNNLLGVAGVNWRVRIMALKFLDPGGSTTDAIAAIEYAIQKGAHLTNNSWGGGGYSGALRDVIAAAGLANQLFVAAAGNDSQNMDLDNSYPAGYDVDNIIAVASIAESGALSGFSNFGATRVHIAAPGSFIYSTWSTSDNAYNSISGTSMACPHVAGAAALLLGQVPTLTYAELRAIILDTARPNPNLVDRVVTNGELDLWAAMQQTGSSLTLDRQAYRSDATVTVTVFDPVIDAAVMMVPADWRVLTALAIERASGVVNLNRLAGGGSMFEGTIILDPGVTADDGDTIIVTYTSGGGDVLIETAPIDDVPPVILDAWVDNITFGTFDVYVTTDEDTRAEIRVGRTLPPAEQTLVNNTFTTDHLFSVAGLEEMSRYYIYIEVEDYAGNITRAPIDPASLVAADYLSAFTLKRNVFYVIDFERGTGGWTAVSLYGADCWEYGEQQYGPEAPKRMWGTRLNGRYPSEVNAILVSPRFETGSAPVLQLRHWFEMQRTGDWIGSRWNQKADAGMVEVLLDGVWHSIMPYTVDAVMGSFTRSSGGWMTSLFYLPPAFAHQSLQIRFRFLSDEFEFDDGNPAGWYIDGVDVSGTGGQGIFISGVEVVDPPLDGDGDGYAEPGETVNLTIQIANLTGVDFDSVTAKMSVFSEGAVSEFVTLVDGTPAQLDFGALLNADYAADGPVTVAIAVDADPDTRVGIELALEAVVGGVTNRYATNHMLSIEPRETLTGTVTDLQTSLPIQDAVVVAQRGMTRHEALTGADGRYTLTGLRSAVTHTVTASKPGVYSPETKRVYVPIASDVDFSLGAAVGALAPDPLAVGVLIGETAEGVFTLTNTGTLPLEYTARLELPDELIERADVVHLAPTEGVVGPGDFVELRVTVRTGDIMPGAYNIDLIVDSNDVLGLPLTAQLQLTILERPALKFVGARGQTGAFPWLVPGLNGEVWVTLGNLNAFSPASGTTGTLSIPDPAHGVIVGAPGMTWPVIPPGGSAESGNSVQVLPDAGLAHGDMIGFSLAVTDGAGVNYVFTFELPVYFFGSVNGEVTCTHWAKDGLSFEVRPASNVTVIAENTLGETVATAQTDADGLYTINNLRAEWHWFRVRTPARPEPPEDEDEAAVWEPGPYYIALEGRAVEVGIDLVADLQMVDYGQDAPFPLLYSVTVRDANADGYLDRGEALELDVRVINDAPSPASNLTGVLAAANMGVPAVMTVSQPDALNAVNLNSQTVPRLLSPAFGVDVDANAPKGALQRFHVTLDGINQYNGQPVRIPLEIRLRADGRIELMGAVSFADGANTEANMQATRIRLQLDNGYDRAIRPLLEGDGVYRYRFGNLPIGIAGAVSVSQVPPGYTFPPAVALAPLVDDVQVDFVIPDGTLDAIVTVPAGLAFTLEEGTTAAGSVTIQNTGGAAEDLHVEIRYRRRQDEAVEPAFAAAESVAETEPKRKSVDWPSVDPDAISPDEVIVRFTPGLKQADMEAALAQAGLEPVFFFSSFPAALARRIAGDIEPVAYAAEAASIEEDKRILQIAPDDKASRFAVLPDDPRFDELFGLLNQRQTGGSLGADIGVTQVWARTTGSHEIIVAVADTGIMINHEDLAANIWVNPAPGSYTNTIVGDVHGWNFFDWSPDVNDWHGHGTHVAGTIGAVGNNTIGIAGVNWHVSLMALRLTDPFGSFTTSARIAKAIEYAAWHGAHVSNHSWGGPDTAGVMYDAIVYAASRNHLVIAAGGNDAYDLDEKRTYPAAYGGVLDNVITVSAVDHHDELAVFSNFGAKTAQLGAPGVDILSTVPDFCVMKLYEVWPWDARYGLSSGTSMAAPHVAGAAGLLWSLTPHSGYQVIRDALLNGVRPVPHLKDWVSTGGVLDVARSAQTLGDDWLTVDTYAFVLPAGGSRVLALTVNDPPVLPARSEAYLADIIVRRADRTQSVVIPVSATVTPGAAWLAIRDVTVDRMGASDDGLAPSPGETVELNVTLHNRGQATATSLIGTITGGAASTIEQADTAWPVLYGGEASAGDVPLRVVLDPGAAGTLEFDLEIRRNGVLLDTLTVSVPILPGRRVRGRIVDADGEPVSGARVEVFGASGGRAISEADGGFTLRGLADGSHHLRIMPQSHNRLILDNVFNLAGADLADIGTFIVSAPLPAFDPLVEQPVVHGFKSQGILTITNSGTFADGPFEYSIHLAPEYRVAVVSDGTSLGDLVQPLHDMGFSVSYYSNNFARIQYFMPAFNYFQVLQDVRYTHEHAFLADFDAVILDMSGPEGTGRLLSSAEESAFAAYTARGGRLILTGANPFSRPDNAGLANLIGTHVLDRAADAEAQSESWQTFDSPFAVLQPGEYLRNVTELRHDLATPIVGTAGAAVQTGAAAKLLHRTRPNDGSLYVWTGNLTGADWSAPGLWQDVLRGILWNELITGTSRQLPWLHLVDGGGVLHHTMSGTLAPGADADITLSMHAAYPVQLEDYHAVAIVLGNYDGADVRSVRITMQVVPALLRAFTTGQVRDWRGLPLQGDGSSRSALLQVLWTGPDGVISPPTIEGLPTGQNELLTAFEAGLTHARFGGGAGVAPDMGRFDWAFRHRIPAVDGQSNTVFVRAWDAETFNRSLVYGDSALYELQFEPGETHNFGSWTLLEILQYNRDSNNDSVPDGWLIENMPWLDPRDPVQPLVSSGVYSNSIPIPAAREPAEPRRVAVTDALIFVLDMMNHRILVYDRASGGITNVIGKAGGDPAAGQWGGWPGTGPGEFTMPSGLALDPRTGVNRLVVADTQSSRIQVLTFDPVNGQVTHVLVFGSAGTDPGQLKRPRGVAVMDGNGDIFVADTENNRVAVFSAAGVHRWSFEGNAGFTLRNPRGIAVDLDYGVYVADTDNYRIVRFTALGMGVAVIHPPVGDPNAFADPTDVHIWRHRWVDGAGIVQREVRRLIVADRYHNRIQLREMDGTHLLNIGRHGILNGELRLPYGAFPVNDSPYVYVADTDNLRIQKFRVVLDADGDGMDDFWEDMNGLDSTVNDAMDAWPSRPDIKNIYAFRASLVGVDPADLIVGVSFTAEVDGVSGSGLILSVQRAEMVTTAESGEPQQIQLSWASVAGRRYRVERVETLGGVWQTVLTYESTGTASSVSVPMDLTRGFFRIVEDQ